MRVPLARPALGRDRATVSFDQRLGDGETQSVAAGVARTRTVAAMKTFEDVGQLRLRNSRAVVFHLNAAPLALGSRANCTRRRPD